MKNNKFIKILKEDDVPQIPPGIPSEPQIPPGIPSEPQIPPGVPSVRGRTTRFRWRSCSGPELEFGCKGQNVADLQNVIINKGIYLKYGADGKFGRNTKQSLMTLQGQIGVSPTGKYDQETINKLKSVGDRSGGTSKGGDVKSPENNTKCIEAERYYNLSLKARGVKLKTKYLEKAIELCQDEKYVEALENMEIVAPERSDSSSDTNKEPQQSSPSVSRKEPEEKMTFLEAFRIAKKETESEDAKNIVYYLFRVKGFSLKNSLSKTLKAFKLRPIEMTGGGGKRQGPYEEFLEKELRMTKDEFEKVLNQSSPVPTEEDYKKNGQLSESKKYLQENYYLNPIRSRFDQVEKLVFERMVKNAR